MIRPYFFHTNEVSKGEFNIDGFIERLLNPSERKTVTITEDEILKICTLTKSSFLEQDTLIKIDSPLKICGDIHGQYFDLLRLFRLAGSPTATRYLFLGDYVDRGKNSLETICLLFSLKSKYPNSFHLLRGNHECLPINRIFGFFSEVKRRFRRANFMQIYLKLNETFDLMPVAAVVDNNAFCCHGGISPSLSSLKNLTSIKRPIFPPKAGLVADILWSDPDESIDKWEKQDNPDINPNHRGIGYLWGKVAHDDFLKRTRLTMVIRAHECVDDGYRWSFDKKLVTIFSAPNYSEGNQAAIANYNATGLLSFTTFQ